MTKAVIYRPAKTAMQSGRRNTRKWVLEFEQAEPRKVDRLMGWTGSADMRQEVKLTFENRDQAIAFAKRNGLDYELVQPHERRLRIKTYADNFRYDRPA
jgi:hypothetical protein